MEDCSSNAKEGNQITEITNWSGIQTSSRRVAVCQRLAYGTPIQDSSHPWNFVSTFFSCLFPQACSKSPACCMLSETLQPVFMIDGSSAYAIKVILNSCRRRRQLQSFITVRLMVQIVLTGHTTSFIIVVFTNWVFLVLHRTSRSAVRCSSARSV